MGNKKYETIGALITGIDHGATIADTCKDAVQGDTIQTTAGAIDSAAQLYTRWSSGDSI